MSQIRDSSVEDAEQLEFQAERRAPFSQLGDWVALAPIRPAAKALYWILSAHINVSRDDTAVWPTQDALAEMMGFSEGRKIRPYLDELVAIDAIAVKKSPPRYVGGLRRTRSVYVIKQQPPQGYEGLESLHAFYAARKARIEAAQAEQNAAETDPETPEAPAAETPGGRNEPPGPGAGTDRSQGAEMGPSEGAEMGPLVRGRNGPPNKTKKNKTKENKTNSGGASRRPPTPPADLTAGHVDLVVTDQRKLVSNQPTARAETEPVDSNPRTDSDDSAAGLEGVAAAPVRGPAPAVTTTPSVSALSAAVDGPESTGGPSMPSRPTEGAVIEFGAVSRSGTRMDGRDSPITRGRPSLRELKAQFDAEKAGVRG